MTKEEKEKSKQGRAVIFGEGVQALRNRRKGPLGGWLLLFVALLLTLIIVPKAVDPDYHAPPGEIAPGILNPPPRPSG